MSAPVRTSVIVCTRNRAASLARLLDSLCRCEPPQRSWELLVVDNGSSDSTPRTLAQFASRLPLRTVHEPIAGLSMARNTGVANAEGEYLVWTDDDATVCREWLRLYESGFDAHPGAAFFAGPIRVRFEGAPPRWLAAGLAPVQTAYAGLDLQEQRAPFDARSRRLPFGANLAVRAVEQREHRYDVALGRHPGRRFYGGEEVDVLHRMARSGAHGVWLPGAAVEHWIDPGRQTRAYLRRYYTGVGYVGKPGELANPTPTGLQQRLRYRLSIVRLDAVYWIGRLLGRHAASLVALRDASTLRGRLIAQRERVDAPQALARSIEGEPT